MLKVEYRSDAATEESKGKTVSGSIGITGSAGPQRERPKSEDSPSVEGEKPPDDPTPDTNTLVLDSFVCRFVAPALQCYSPSLRQCVVLKNRACRKPAVVTVVQCSRSILDVCFPIQKYCEV